MDSSPKEIFIGILVVTVILAVIVTPIAFIVYLIHQYWDEIVNFFINLAIILAGVIGVVLAVWNVVILVRYFRDSQKIRAIERERAHLESLKKNEKEKARLEAVKAKAARERAEEERKRAEFVVKAKSQQAEIESQQAEIEKAKGIQAERDIVEAKQRISEAKSQLREAEAHLLSIVLLAITSQRILETNLVKSEIEQAKAIQSLRDIEVAQAQQGFFDLHLAAIAETVVDQLLLTKQVDAIQAEAQAKKAEKEWLKAEAEENTKKEERLKAETLKQIGEDKRRKVEEEARRLEERRRVKEADAKKREERRRIKELDNKTKNRNKQYDVFISHASEDKKEVAGPLAEGLKKMGLEVWYDTDKLRVGDNLVSGLNNGLIESRSGIVILSSSYFRKDWTRAELEGLIQLEVSGRIVMLPILYDVTVEQVTTYAPILARNISLSWKDGLEKVVEKIYEAIVKVRVGGIHNQTYRRQ